MENLESHVMLECCFQGLESYGMLCVGSGKSWKIKLVKTYKKKILSKEDGKKMIYKKGVIFRSWTINSVNRE